MDYNYPKETFYHCPSIQDIQYVHGTFVATTNYNAIQMNWFTVQNFPEGLVPIKKFNFTDNWNDCVGGTCAIYCVYEIESKRDTVLKFSVSRQEYRFSQPVSGPWKNGVCESNKPEDCIFTVVPDQW